ncbi:WXG100 family type VII secretion target [Paenibacillus sp. alder61]|uniref:WXG100 family type VII secretion target n=1 Tax=Paenibacillus faecis TaxID=862114 RepID=A0A5D0D447_9BACL|nr:MULTISPECIES: WXG100 family type VII secretion target [Paenibacillus]MCA1293768.1 WXG100 family type VII secretion target [Paenibacillus sp. alder61]TYA15355.1 hypothetical protein FRY98_06935 [Paenibacillus faecis]
MSTVSEIKAKAKLVYDVKSDLKSDSTKCQAAVNQSKDWWQGEAGNGFRTGYKEIQREVTGLLGKLDKLSSGLNRLADRVDQADEARKAKAAAEKSKGAAVSGR